MQTNEKIDLLIKVKVLLKKSLEIGDISENFYNRLRAGIDSVIYTLENSALVENADIANSSDWILEELAIIAKNPVHNDFKVKSFIDQEINMLNHFIAFIEKQGKMGVEEYHKLLNAQREMENTNFF